MMIDKLTIQQKLAGMSLLGILFVIGIGFTGFFEVTQMQSSMEEVTSNVSIIRNHLTADMMHDALKSDVLQAMIDARNDSIDKETIKQNLREHAGIFRDMIEKNKALISSEALQAVFLRLGLDLEEYISAAEEIVFLAYNDLESIQNRIGSFNTAFEKIAGEMEEVSDMIEAGSKSIQTRADQSIKTAKTLIIGISIGVVILLGLFSRRISASIVQPIRALSEASKKIGDGDFSVELNTEGKDGLAILARGFAGMAEKLKSASDASANTLARAEAMLDGSHANMIFANNDFIIEYMNPASMKALKKIEHLLPVAADDMIGTCIDRFHANPARVRGILENEHTLPHKANITLGDQTLELIAVPIHDHNGNRIGQMATWAITTEKMNMERALVGTSTSVSSASDELAAASQQMKSQSSDALMAAEEAFAISKNTDENVSSVAAAAEEMAATVSEISKNVQEATQITNSAVIMSNQMNDKIGKLAASSKEIGQVVKVINTIAGKTNLLALNATIEAARAGEAGKGFAVVASEVKDLANATATATGEIQDKIKAIQSNTDEAVDAIKKIGEIVEKTNEISTTIAGAVEEQSATTGEITRNMAEAAQGAKAVSLQIEKISESSKSMNEGTENVLSSSVELSRMSGDLMALIPSSESVDEAKGSAASENGSQKTPVHA